jgi:hypothetical protein
VLNSHWRFAFYIHKLYSEPMNFTYFAHAGHHHTTLSTDSKIAVLAGAALIVLAIAFTGFSIYRSRRAAKAVASKKQK